MDTNDTQATNVSKMADDQGEPGSLLVQLVPDNWEDCIDLLLAAHTHGTPAGRALARANFTHLARLADLASDVLTHLKTCSDTPDEVWMGKCQTLIGRANALWRDVPATDLQAYEAPKVGAGGPDASNEQPGEQAQAGLAAESCRRPLCGRRGALATAAGRPDLELQVLYSAAGFYLGTWSETGPFTRESLQYWPRRELAQQALVSGDWTQRLDH